MLFSGACEDESAFRGAELLLPLPLPLLLLLDLKVVKTLVCVPNAVL